MDMATFAGYLRLISSLSHCFCSSSASFNSAGVNPLAASSKVFSKSAIALSPPIMARLTRRLDSATIATLPLSGRLTPFRKEGSGNSIWLMIILPRCNSSSVSCCLCASANVLNSSKSLSFNAIVRVLCRASKKILLIPPVLTVLTSPCSQCLSVPYL